MVSDEDFRTAMSHFASGVTVMTTADSAGRPHGLTVSAFCSLSATPPLVLACIHKETASHYAFLERQAFVVHILGADQQHISQHFAERVVDKFFGTDVRESADGLPIGVQVIGRPFEEHLVLDVAAAIERGCGGWVAPPTAGGTA